MSIICFTWLYNGSIILLEELIDHLVLTSIQTEGLLEIGQHYDFFP